MKPHIHSLVLFALLACFAASPTAQAVVPPPDGGYPGENTAEGTHALFSLTTGEFNTGLGWLALQSNTRGNYNTAAGAGALFSNRASEQNTATGAGALFNCVGNHNTANGAFALYTNSIGSGNTAIGSNALYSNTQAYANTAIGYQALLNNDAPGNTAIGFDALYANTKGWENTAIGYFALTNNTTGGFNTVIGEGALSNNTTGSENIALGDSAGFLLDPGANFNIVIGNDGQSGDASTIRIGNTNHTRAFIAGIRGVTTENMDAVPVLIDSTGQLGTMSSSRRYKKEIKPMDKASEAILALNPVTFQYKSDGTNTVQFGLVAEDVAEVNPNLVVCDENGEIYTVRYDAVNAMLLNEFLKAHKRIEEQEVTIAELKKELQATATQQQKQIEALTAGLQKVSAQLELSKAAPQTVSNRQ